MLDVDKPRFALAQLQEIAPKLKPKVFHNWVARGIIQFPDEPRADVRRRYSVALALSLKFVTEAIDLGVRVGDAFELANVLLDAIGEFENRFTPVIEDGLISYKFETWTHYRRGMMTRRSDGSATMVIEEARSNLETSARLVRQPAIYLTVEIDMLIADVLNATYRMMRNGAIK